MGQLPRSRDDAVCAYPLPQPIPSTPSSPERSEYPLGPLEEFVAPFPTTAIVFGAFRGRTLPVFLRRTVDAAPIVRIKLSAVLARSSVKIAGNAGAYFLWSAWTSMWEPSPVFQELKLTAGKPESWPRRYLEDRSVSGSWILTAVRTYHAARIRVAISLTFVSL